VNRDQAILTRAAAGLTASLRMLMFHLQRVKLPQSTEQKLKTGSMLLGPSPSRNSRPWRISKQVHCQGIGTRRPSFQGVRAELQTMWTKLKTFGESAASLPTVGRSVTIRSVAGGIHAPKVLDATISNDGRIIVADFSERANNLTPKDQQIPWDRLS
jgi:hypothetical protein